MKANRTLQEFDGKTIFITGATGFLAKLTVEKLLRVQPNVKKLFLLVRASNARSAEQRLRKEIIDSELFRVIRDEWGNDTTSFITTKVVPISGDVSHENLGINDAYLSQEICGEVDFIISMAATTNFNERYDVAMDINAFGTMNVLKFAKRCPNLKLLLHVSTAFVHASRPGLLLEGPFDVGETPKDVKTSYLDIEAEKKLVEETKARLQAQNITDKEFTSALRDLGTQRANVHGWTNVYSLTKAMGEIIIGKFKEGVNVIIVRPTIITSTLREPFSGWIEGLRTLDSIFAVYRTGKLKFFLGDPDSVQDMIPGDMVVNCILSAMAMHCDSREVLIYQVGSSLRNPIRFGEAHDIMYRFIKKKPLLDSKGKPINIRKIRILSSMISFRRYIGIRYLPFLKMLKLLNVIFCNRCQSSYENSTRKIKLTVRFAELYEPYIFFQGIFDDANTEDLRRRATNENTTDPMMLDFDPSPIDWEQYFIETHFPGICKYELKQ